MATTRKQLSRRLPGTNQAVRAPRVAKRAKRRLPSPKSGAVTAPRVAKRPKPGAPTKKVTVSKRRPAAMGGTIGYNLGGKKYTTRKRRSR